MKAQVMMRSFVMAKETRLISVVIVTVSIHDKQIRRVSGHHNGGSEPGEKEQYVECQNRPVIEGTGSVRVCDDEPDGDAKSNDRL